MIKCVYTMYVTNKGRENKYGEVACLRYVSEIPFKPDIGDHIRIGDNTGGNITSISWVESLKVLRIHLGNENEGRMTQYINNMLKEGWSFGDYFSEEI